MIKSSIICLQRHLVKSERGRSENIAKIKIFVKINNNMALGMNDLKPGVFFIYEGQPYVVLETHHLKMQQRRPTLQTKFKNLLNGKTYERNFQQSDVFEEADIVRQNVKF